MRTLVGVGAAMLIAVAIGVWSNAASRSTTEATVSKATLVSLTSPVSTLGPATSIWEMHNRAHLENLPVQEVDDQTFVLTAEHVASK
jgi:hypothetical protein